MKQRISDVLAVLGELAWRGFGALMFILGSSAGLGAIVTGSWTNGVVIAWGTLMLGIVGALGYAIMVTGKATKQDVAKAYRDAAEKVAAEEEAKKRK